ncbi:anti-sigma factor family protein [Thermospira aquatica]|uniref:Zf-HC2 domain-containing protein n=1 Tax=Thermospira aquatica TaxID=2828656 RepID=A0AAX3BEF6_9SPIR|nr:zf-HC2 domain-containing protein [Thermospira aquatica]URA10141.1 zf-HC2 domain-containing protein [Thermospira aquatica]
MEKTICNRVMDFLDEHPEDILAVWVEEHLATCPHCQNYAMFSRRLRNLSLKHHKLPQPLTPPVVAEYKNHPVRWVVAIAATLVISLGIGIGLLTLNRPSSVITLSDTAPTMETTQTIDYYTEIALLW